MIPELYSDCKIDVYVGVKRMNYSDTTVNKETCQEGNTLSKL